MSESETEGDSEEQTQDQEAGRLGLRGRAELFDVVFAAVQAADDEAIAEFTESGLTMHVVDPGNVLLSFVHVPADAFESYAAGNLSLGLELPRLVGTTKAADEEINLEWDREDYRLNAKAAGIDASLSTIDPDSIATQASNRDRIYENATVEFTVTARDLRTAMSAGDVINSDHCELHASDSEDGFTGLKFKGDTDDVDAEFRNAEFAQAGEDARVVLSVDYLKSLKQAVPIDAEMTCHTASDFPAIFVYESEGVEVEIMIAPRLDK